MIGSDVSRSNANDSSAVGSVWCSSGEGAGAGGSVLEIGWNYVRKRSKHLFSRVSDQYFIMMERRMAVRRI